MPSRQVCQPRGSRAGAPVASSTGTAARPNELCDSIEERLLLGLAALDVATCSPRMTAAAKLGCDRGDVDVLGDTSHADAPARLGLIENGRRAAAFGTRQKVDDAFGFRRIGSTL